MVYEEVLLNIIREAQSWYQSLKSNSFLALDWNEPDFDQLHCR